MLPLGQIVKHLHSRFLIWILELFLLKTGDEPKLKADWSGVRLYVEHMLRKLHGQAAAGRSRTPFAVSTLGLHLLFPTPHKHTQLEWCVISQCNGNAFRVR